MLYLRLPVAIESSGETLAGEIYLPSRMRGLSICVTSSRTSPVQRQHVCERLGEAGRAALLLLVPGQLLPRHVIAAVDWVRSKRLLRTLPIAIVALGNDTASARKAAHLRPVAVSAVTSGLAAAV